MKARRFRPRRRLRIEVVQLLASLALPAAILYVFPYKALAPSAKVRVQGVRRAVPCALVTLEPDQERRILAAAKAAWQVSAEGVRRLRLDMFAEEIPDVVLDPVADISARTRTPRSAPSPVRPSVPPTDLRAAPPEAIAPAVEEPAATHAFPREELLRLE